MISSWGGVPVRTSGTALETLLNEGPALFASHPGRSGVYRMKKDGLTGDQAFKERVSLTPEQVT